MFEVGSLRVEPAGDARIVISRTFHAPKELIYRALISPDLLADWIAPRGWSVSLCESDARAGGAYRFALTGPGGTRLAWRGAYVALFASDRLVQTETYEASAIGLSLVTTSLVD